MLDLTVDSPVPEEDFPGIEEGPPSSVLQPDDKTNKIKVII